MKEQVNAFKKLVRLSNSLKRVNYEDIKLIIRESIQKIPLCIGNIRKGYYIDRARINEGDKLYYCEKQVSYISDPEVINNYLTEFGRANKPHEPIFYGSIISTLVEQPRMTALWETSKLLQKKCSINIGGELFTISRFDIVEDFKILEMVFSKKAIQVNPDIRRRFQDYLMLVESIDPKLIEFAQQQLVFFSEQFARKTKNHTDYKISCAYSELILDNYRFPDGSKLSGVAFPSVQSGLTGQNIAMRPNCVDKYLKLSGVWTVKIHKNRKKAVINNHKQVKSFGKNNCSFIWEDTDPRYVRPYSEIEKELANKGCLGFGFSF